MSSGILEIIDPESERNKKRKRKVLILAVLYFVAGFSYPVLQEYKLKWKAIRESSDLVSKLNALKTDSILNKKTLEANFAHPNKVIIFESTSCGVNSKKTKVLEYELADGVVFLKAVDATQDVEWDPKEVILSRFCYDPRFGSSLHADGLARGVIALSHQNAKTHADFSDVVKVVVEGPSADLSIE